MSQPLADNLDALEVLVSTAPGLALFLDFDGTLTPLTPDPSQAGLPAGVRSLLLDLLRLPSVCLTVISGRTIASLRERCGIEEEPEAIYAGCYGLEIHGAGFDFREPGAVSRMDSLRALCGELRREIERFPGAILEDKVLCASVHYRALRSSRRRALEVALRRLLAPAAGLFLLRRGILSFEIVPRVGWDKGRAAVLIMDRYPGRLAVCAGDDTSDEDLFRALPDAISVRVGRPRPTAARFHVNGPPEIRTFLAWLWATRACASGAAGSQSLRSRSKAALIRPR